MYDSEAPSDAVQEAFGESEFFTTQEAVDEVSWPYYWSTEDWDVSEGDLILDFIRESRKVRCTGVWRVLGQINRGGVTAVEYVPSPLGLRFTKTDMASLGRLVTRYGVFTEDRRWDLLDIVPLARELRDGIAGAGD